MTILRFALTMTLAAALMACGDNGTTPPCDPACNMISCGADDGCGGTCGCEDDKSCVDNICTDGDVCEPSCDMVNCDVDDGCGGTCGCDPDSTLYCILGTCSNAGQEPECHSGAPCDDGFECVDGSCAPVPTGCEEDGDCDGDDVCVDGTCSEVATGCETDDDCDGEMVCVDGTCSEVATGCETDDDCDDGWSCVDGACMENAVEGCETDADCESVAECCETGTCGDDGVCTMTPIADCCESSAQCDDGDPDTNDICANACAENGCESYPVVGCDDATVHAWSTFDDGSSDGTLFVDLDPSDSATVDVSTHTAVSPGYSVHFGATGCPTYYSGSLTDCVPTDSFANDSSPLNLELQILAVELNEDEDVHLTFWADVAAEPALDLGGGTIYDVDYLVVYIEGETDNTVVWKSTEAFGVENNSGGFVHQAVDLSAWAGQTVNVHFNFITDGAGDWSATETWHGAYLDDIAIETSCVDTLCTEAGGACPNDGDFCTADTCTGFANGDGGICAYESATPGGECDGCVVDADCGADDECNTYSCDAGLCSVTVDASCCNEGSSYPATGDGGLNAEGFEGDAFFTEWTLEDAYNDNVSWQVTSMWPYSGDNALYFGDPDTLTYAAVPANPAQATAWSPAFTVGESAGSTVLSFQLYMSTEYDGAEAPCPGDDYDSLSVWIAPFGADAEMVWSSDAAICNTTNGAYIQVGIDMGAYEGEVVEVGFMFDSMDPDGVSQINDYEGVYIDDLSVSSWCNDECMGASDCGASDACTEVQCSLGTCETDTYEGCCIDNSDCVSDNACATGTCEDSFCSYDYTDDLSCCSATWIGGETEDFEDGWGGFTSVDDSAPVVWHLTEDDSASGTTSMTFSDPATGTYSTPGTVASSGALWSPEIMVPPFSTGTPYVEFQLMLETEWDVNDPADFFAALGFPLDELCVGIASADEMATYSSCFSDSSAWRTWHLTNTTHGEWVTARVDLSDYRGETVQVAWEFEGDSIANSYGGPYIDDVAFGTACDAPECLDSSECTSSDSCYAAACVNWECVETPIDSPLCCWPGADESLAIDFEGDASWDNEACSPGAGGDDDPTSIWQVTNAAGTGGISPSQGSQMLYFGNGLDYGGDGGFDASALASCGATESAVFSLDPAESWTLEFDLFTDIEPNPGCAGGGFAESDDFWISVVDYSNASTENLVFDKSELDCADFGGWTSLSIDLDAWSGSNIAVRFTFDSYDNFANDGLGLAVDDLQFVKGCE